MPREALRRSHLKIRLYDRSSKMEDRLNAALQRVERKIKQETGLSLVQQRTMQLSEIVDRLNATYRECLDVVFERAFKQTDNTWLKPDGGFWYVEDWGDPRRWVLVAEAKRQGTNVDRLREGKPKQAKGNAIERLGKNMRGFDMLFLGEAITPFVCFGEGCDFAPDSSILDRVSTLNSFFPLNQIYVQKVYLSDGEVLKPSSLFFREQPWTPKEMYTVLLEVAQRAIRHYREKYAL